MLTQRPSQCFLTVTLEVMETSSESAAAANLRGADMAPIYISLNQQRGSLPVKCC